MRMPGECYGGMKEADFGTCVVIGEECIHKRERGTICAFARRRGRYSTFGGCYKTRFVKCASLTIEAHFSDQSVPQKLLHRRQKLDSTDE